MTTEEYEAMSEAFTAINVELVRAVDSGEQTRIDTARAAFVKARADLDAAHAQLNGADGGGALHHLLVDASTASTPDATPVVEA